MDKLFNFQNKNHANLRAAIIDGEIYFVGNDVASMLGYKAPKGTIRYNVPESNRYLILRDNIGEYASYVHPAGNCTIPSYGYPGIRINRNYNIRTCIFS